MSRILVTHCGRNGDCLWGMATARALAEQAGHPVDLILPQQYAGLAPLLRQQAYLESVMVDEDWVVQQSAPITPRSPIMPLGGWPYEAVHHLGYAGWPLPDVARDPFRRYMQAGNWPLLSPGDPPHPTLDLSRPWITVPKLNDCAPVGCTIGFTDEWFELKLGIFELVTKHPTIYPRSPGNWLSVSAVDGSRWQQEAGHRAGGWVEIAQDIANAKVFLGCCSALHVLAVAMGISAVILEPNPHRHNAIFYPCGTTGPQVTLVLGNDGLPTNDARHCWDTVKAVLERNR